MTADAIPTIYIVSDGRGDTCHQWLRAALVQFMGHPFDLVRWSEILTVAEVDRVVGEAARCGATIFFTMVGEDTRRAMVRRSQQLLVPAVDVLGPAFAALNDLFNSAPSRTPGLFYATERESLDRHAAIDYTLKHDDGQRPGGLDVADIVLVGVSRSSKSSTCFYLAYQGVKAANVPLVPDRPVPQQLLEIPRDKVVGLVMNVPRLVTLREARAANLGYDCTRGYSDRREVAREVRYANALMQQHGWRTVNASYLAIEEIAREVMRLAGR
ncbi:kinase/pyrophosphorylase [bacterium]|nr:kinase/pyrophosphorylase [bacterium]